MNELDSELIRGQLAALGYHFIDDRAAADVVLFNTCSVREQAENKVLSRVGQLGMEKDQEREVIVGLVGCLAEREGERLITRFPQIDLLCGPGELDRLPQLLENAFKGAAVEQADRIALQGNRSRRSAALSAAQDNLEALDLSRAFDPDRTSTAGRSAYVRITRGCNKFCTYCVVPNTRGAEVHRPPDAIVDECMRLADEGVIEVTLLGQTVNHYCYTHGTAVSSDGRELAQVGPGLAAFRSAASNGARVTTFADLLHRIHESVPAIRRLRFVTSYPRDFSDEALGVMRDCPRICRYLHVPAQSGSNEVLARMNRGYSVEQYEAFIERARSTVPGIEIAGDIIVGFPGETEDDFDATCDLLRRVRFKNNFVFRYSPRPGTVAIKRLEDDVPEDRKRARLNSLLALQADIGREVHAAYEGRTVEILVERHSPHAQSQADNGIEVRWQQSMTQLSGRTDGDLICVFDAPADAAEHLLGEIVTVHVEGSGPLILKGRLLQDSAIPMGKWQSGGFQMR